MKNTILIAAAVVFMAIGEKVSAAPDEAPAEKQGNAGKKGKRQMPKAEWVDPNQTAPNGTKYETFNSKALGKDVSFLVYLPPGYEQDSKRFPVIYWLHGLGGNQRAGASMLAGPFNEAIKNGSMPPAIMVFINGMVNSFYCDWVDGQRPMESVIIKDLIPHIDQTYRTLARREARIIQGFSMGGYGAAHLGFKYPELFGTVVVDSGALLDPNAAVVPVLKVVFGDDDARRKAEHPESLARLNADKLRGKTRIHIGVGSLDNLLPRNKSLHEVLQELKIDDQFEIIPEVGHDPPLYYRTLGAKCFEFQRRALEAMGKE